MTGGTEHLQLRQFLKDTSNKIDFKWKTRQGVYPPDKKYSTIFMNAQRRDLRWVYQGDLPDESLITNELSIGWCVRSDSFGKSGMSNRHLCGFEMLGINGIMREDDAIDKVVKILKTSTKVTNEQIFTNVSLDNKLAVNTLSDLGIYIRDKPTSFSRNDTNRTGHRIEFNVSFKTKEGILQEWEVQNMVILTGVEGITIKKPIIDSGGSFERLVTINEKVDSVFENSILKTSVDYVKQILAKNSIFEINAAESITDLVRTFLIMAESGFVIGTKTRQEQTYRKLAREIGMKIIQYEIDMPNFINIVNYLRNEKNSYNECLEEVNSEISFKSESGFFKMVETMRETYNKIYIKLLDGQRSNENLTALVKQLSRTYDGASDNGLAQLALKKMSVKK